MINNKLYEKELECQLEKINYKFLTNKKILITGAYGLICSYIIDLLMYANQKYNSNIKIYALSRSNDKLKKRFDKYFNSDLFVPIIQDVCTAFNLKNIDYIVHGASNANPRLYIEDPVGTMNANYIGMLNVLELAKKCNSSVIYISSSDVYGEVLNKDELLENDYGYVDILNIRSSYASSKRATETLCCSYSSQFKINVKIVRPAHVFGPTMTPNDTRAVSDFLRNVTKNENIIMKSDGTSVRSYIYVADVVTGIFKVLFYGDSGQAYNISNSNNIISIRELAKLIAEKCKKELIIELPKSNIDKKIDTNVKTIKISNEKLIKLGWKPYININEGIEKCIEMLK